MGLQTDIRLVRKFADEIRREQGRRLSEPPRFAGRTPAESAGDYADWMQELLGRQTTWTPEDVAQVKERIRKLRKRAADPR